MVPPLPTCECRMAPDAPVPLQRMDATGVFRCNEWLCDRRSRFSGGALPADRPKAWRQTRRSGMARIKFDGRSGARAPRIPTSQAHGAPAYTQGFASACGRTLELRRPRSLQERRLLNGNEEYQTEGGVNTNHVESFFSRIQGAYFGIHHRFSVRYFDWYAAENAWCEDNRRVDKGLQLWVCPIRRCRGRLRGTMRLLAGQSSARPSLGECRSPDS
ncbi:transposase [Rhizobium mayense]|uniref:transposase n=1 Tax=Rhizobium mayense TaxID=1312184 RepID=UPI003D80ACD1